MSLSSIYNSELKSISTMTTTSLSSSDAFEIGRVEGAALCLLCSTDKCVRSKAIEILSIARELHKALNNRQNALLYEEKRRSSSESRFNITHLTSNGFINGNNIIITFKS